MSKSTLRVDEADLQRQLVSQAEGTFAQKDWDYLWENHECPPWHINDVNRGLQLHYEALTAAKKGEQSTVFVPLCGRSLDLLWLHKQGHCVIGVELNQPAVETFFSANSIPFTKETEHGMTVFNSHDGNIKVFICNILDFRREYLPVAEVDAVWDRGSFVAIDPISRTRYINIIASLMATGARSLFERVDYLGDYLGPPFLFTDEELTKLCGDQFEIQYLSERPDERNDEWLLKCFLFTKK